MTKMFNSIEELNQFLEGGKTISNISFSAGMISVVVSDSQVQENCPKKDATSSLSVIIDDIMSAFLINKEKDIFGQDKLVVTYPKMKSIIDYATGLPETTAIAVVTYFASGCGVMRPYEAREELRNALDLKKKQAMKQ